MLRHTPDDLAKDTVYDNLFSSLEKGDQRCQAPKI